MLKNIFSQRFVGGGGAAIDFDRDGWMDLYLVQGATWDETPSPALRNRLFRNDGSGKFVYVSNGSGTDNSDYPMGAIAGDFDNDVWTDLYVTNLGPNVLFRNKGDGTFTNVTNQAGISAAAGNGLGVLANDFNNDGYTDIFVANDMTYNILWIIDGEGNFKMKP